MSPQVNSKMTQYVWSLILLAICPVQEPLSLFFYLSLPSYLFVHSRTCSSLFEYIKKWDDMGSVNLAILFVFIGCGSNVFFLEHLINLDPTRNRFKCSATLNRHWFRWISSLIETYFEMKKVEILLHVANFYSLHLNVLRTSSGSLKYL